MKVVMEHEIRPKVMKFIMSNFMLPILPLNFTKFVPFLWTLRNLASPHFPTFCMNANLSREMVLENLEMVMEKSWGKKVQNVKMTSKYTK